jgi:hypothetical protein
LSHRPRPNLRRKLLRIGSRKRTSRCSRTWTPLRTTTLRDGPFQLYLPPTPQRQRRESPMHWVRDLRLLRSGRATWPRHASSATAIGRRWVSLAVLGWKTTTRSRRKILQIGGRPSASEWRRARIFTRAGVCPCYRWMGRRPRKGRRRRSRDRRRDRLYRERLMHVGGAAEGAQA